MKDKLIGIGLAVVLASGIFLSVFGAGEGASQKWVSHEIVQATSNIEYRTDMKLAELRKQLDSTLLGMQSILSNTNDTNAIAKAISIIDTSTAPIATTLIQSSVKISY